MASPVRSRSSSQVGHEDAEVVLLVDAVRPPHLFAEFRTAIPDRYANWLVAQRPFGMAPGRSGMQVCLSCISCSGGLMPTQYSKRTSRQRENRGPNLEHCLCPPATGVDHDRPIGVVSLHFAHPKGWDWSRQRCLSHLRMKRQRVGESSPVSVRASPLVVGWLLFFPRRSSENCSPIRSR